MKLSKKALILTAFMAFTALVPVSQTFAATTVVKTVVKSVPMPGYKDVNFEAFDINQDGVLTRKEVGSFLFKLFDQDGNRVLDNIEWNSRNVMTLTPMEKTTMKFVDMNDDGTAVLTSYSKEDFWRASGLAVFDSNKDGLSAHDFLGKYINEVDTNNDGFVSMKEFERVYYVRPFDYLHNDNSRYNY